MNGVVSRIAVAVGCVILISVGQLLFRQTGLAIERSGTWFDQRAAYLLLIALAAYGLATLGWVHVLRTTPLAVAYPIMGLSFVLIPLLSTLVLGEYPSTHQMVGTVLVIAGIIVAQTGA